MYLFRKPVDILTLEHPRIAFPWLTRLVGAVEGKISGMWSRKIITLAALAVALWLTVGLTAFAQNSHSRGRKYKAPPPTSRIEVTILRGDNGKPIENASVIFHIEGDKGNMELKTNEDGKSAIDVLPTGSTVLLQVIAKGYQTYGKDYKLDKPEMAIEVKLKLPGKQYSIYEDHSDTASSGNANSSTSGAAKKDAAKDSSGEKPASKQPQ